ncbi:hypothetical protein IE53DRAFT_371392 [Violaceomyces palustris]|uniref:Uncharacterized protein n=1 Tax=Violaceomyces palustris TaxID=1673888 RepID=A0ACD0NNY2_9BASI|nr:hypothetical protein IE53DRAFT_371392 [Violaceomyces palustris]
MVSFPVTLLFAIAFTVFLTASARGATVPRGLVYSYAQVATTKIRVCHCDYALKEFYQGTEYAADFKQYWFCYTENADNKNPVAGIGLETFYKCTPNPPEQLQEGLKLFEKYCDYYLGRYSCHDPPP